MEFEDWLIQQGCTVSSYTYDNDYSELVKVITITTPDGTEYELAVLP